ncbi:MAG TPA: AsmA family protein [Rudaea sp.]|nr:AsmA family protein [Rudaea sp.]
MKRHGKLLLGIAGAIVVLVAVAITILATFDWNRAKPWVVATVGQAIGRSIVIDGDLSLAWRRDSELEGWRSWLPTPHVTAAKVSVGNTGWGKAGQFGTADSVEFDLAMLPLLTHAVHLESIRFIAPNANLERLDDGRDNWTFTATSDPPSTWTFDIGRIALDEGRFSFVDHGKAIDISGKIEALGQSIPFDDLVVQQARQARDEIATQIGAKGTQRLEQRAARRAEARRQRGKPPQRYAFSWSAQGTYRKEPFKGNGRVGGVFFLRNPDRPFPLQADVKIGDTRIAFVGTLVDPLDLDTLDLHLWVSGSNLSQLYDIARITLPNSPRYAMEGRLVGRYKAAARKLRYEDFIARIGDSDLSGNLQYESRKPRPLLSGDIQSDELQFRDLAPLIGAHVKDDGSAQPPNKLLPVTPFRPERWQAMDADVHFAGDHVFRDSELPIHKVDTRIVMDDAVVLLEPLKFRYAYGDVDATLRMDGRSAPIKATLELSARDMRLKHLFPADPGQVTLGRADGDARLTSTGDSVGALLGNANGQLKVRLGGGTISKGLLETVGLNLPNIVATKMFGDKQVKIDCAAADLVARSGVFESRSFVIDTDIALIDITGKVDLAHERVDLVVHPHSKGIRLFSLRSPIDVKGPFRDIDVGVDKGALLARAAGAIGLGVIAAPAAALVPLTSTSLGTPDNRCVELLDAAQMAPAAKAVKK